MRDALWRFETKREYDLLGEDYDRKARPKQKLALTYCFIYRKQDQNAFLFKVFFLGAALFYDRGLFEHISNNYLPGTWLEKKPVWIS